MTTQSASNKVINKYLKLVEKNLQCSAAAKKQILTALESDIFDYLEKYPNATFADVVKCFGDADVLTTESLDLMDSKDIKKKVNKSKFFKHIVLLVGILTLICITSTAICIINQNSKKVSSFYAQGITQKIGD